MSDKQELNKTIKSNRDLNKKIMQAITRNKISNRNYDKTTKGLENIQESLSSFGVFVKHGIQEETEKAINLHIVELNQLLTKALKDVENIQFNTNDNLSIDIDGITSSFIAEQAKETKEIKQLEGAN